MPGADAPLQFWQAVEELKLYEPGKEKYMEKLEEIKKMFLNGHTTDCKSLMVLYHNA